MKIAIIGGSGFIGSALLKRLAESNEVKGSFFSGKRQEEGLIKQTLFSHVDLSDRTSLLRFIENQDIVINCSGALAHWNTTKKELFQTNVEGTKNVLWALHKAGRPYYIHFSTCGVSGPSISLCINNEEEKINPADYYAYTKLLGERLVNNYFSCSAGRGAILRPTWSYGVGDRHKLQLFRAIKSRKFALINNGKARFQPIYIDDICDAVEEIINKRPEGGTYLLSGPEAITQRDAFIIIREALNQPDYQCTQLGYGTALGMACLLTLAAKVLRIKTPFNLIRFRLFAMNWLYNGEKIQKDTGFIPSVSFKDGVERTLQWYKEKELL